jgi:protein phosphatase
VELVVPDPSLVLLIGPSGSGKTTFARRLFEVDEVLSSDRYRFDDSGDENDMSANERAFDRLHADVAMRLGAGRLTVVDATNVHLVARATLLDLARRAGVPAGAVVFDLPGQTLRERLASRTDRAFRASVVARQRTELRRSLPGLADEGFAAVLVLRSGEEADAVTLRRAGFVGP